MNDQEWHQLQNYISVMEEFHPDYGFQVYRTPGEAVEALRNGDIKGVVWDDDAEQLYQEMKENNEI